MGGLPISEWYFAEALTLIEQGAGATAAMVNIKVRFDLDWAEADEIADAAGQHQIEQSKTRQHP